jgi:DNA repair protein SbcC/Rad50
LAYYAIASRLARIARQLRPIHLLHLANGHLDSPALALAFSGQVRHKTLIDSLFLDEGFGTLDASCKIIGVINHVEGMKERIPAQIRLEKGGGVGYSRLSI